MLPHPTRSECLRYTLILGVVTLLRADHRALDLLHAGHAWIQSRQAAAGLVRVVLVVANACILSLLQRDARIVGGRNYLRHAIEEVDHAVHVKLFRRGTVHVLATAVDEALEGRLLRAVQVEGFA